MDGRLILIVFAVAGTKDVAVVDNVADIADLVVVSLLHVFGVQQGQ
jgi:hypothetical protein